MILDPTKMHTEDIQMKYGLTPKPHSSSKQDLTPLGMYKQNVSNQGHKDDVDVMNRVEFVFHNAGE